MTGLKTIPEYTTNGPRQHTATRQSRKVRVWLGPGRSYRLRCSRQVATRRRSSLCTLVALFHFGRPKTGSTGRVLLGPLFVAVRRSCLFFLPLKNGHSAAAAATTEDGAWSWFSGIKAVSSCCSPPSSGKKLNGAHSRLCAGKAMCVTHARSCWRSHRESAHDGDDEIRVLEAQKIGFSNFTSPVFGNRQAGCR